MSYNHLFFPYPLVFNFTGLATAIFGIGMHQELNDHKVPFFLSELRRKLFWFTYFSDKCFATFFGRPPLINGKFCSRKMPLDLDNSQLALAGEDLQSALDTLDENGWNPNSTISSSSWLRVSISIGKFREEILELSLGTDTEDLLGRGQ